MSNKSVLFVLIAIVVLSCQPFTQGERLYVSNCAVCHMEDGSGLAGLIPTLVDADYLSLGRTNVPCIIKYGNEDTIIVNGVPYGEPMPAFPGLNEVEISNIINYIHTSWGNELPVTSPDEVRSALEMCE